MPWESLRSLSLRLLRSATKLRKSRVHAAGLFCYADGLNVNKERIVAFLSSKSTIMYIDLREIFLLW